MADNSNINDFIGFVAAFVLFVAASNAWFYVRQWRNNRKKNKHDAEN